MKDSLAITAQAIPFLNDFKNFTYLCFIIMHRKDNTLSAYYKKKRTHFPANPFQVNIMKKIKNYEKSSVILENQLSN